MVKELTDLTFEKEISKADKPMLVDFWAEWCAPCKMQAPVIEELDSELSDKIIFAKVNVDDNMQIASALSISGIPTLLLYKNGEIVQKIVGYTPKAELSEILLKNI